MRQDIEVTPSTKNEHFILSSSAMVYSLFAVGLVAMTYSLITQNWLILGSVIFFPLAAIMIFYAVEKPMLSYAFFAIVTCYFSAIYRYIRIENLSGILDIFLAICLFSILLNVLSNRNEYPWKNGLNILFITYLFWITYCFLILLAPYAHINDFSSSGRVVFIALPLTYFISGVLLCSTQKLRLALMLFGIFVITAALKVYWQKTKGFDSYEGAWLMAGNWRTHLLQTGTRYFSFFTDAGNFGSSMGMFGIAFGVIAAIAQKRVARLSCLVVSILALVGMMMSGTRGAMIVPFGGIVLYFFLSKSLKIMAISIILGALTFCFFYFTDIGDSNTFIKRMRTAFRPTEDTSFNVRAENQKRFAYYLADKPFGLGVGGTVVDTKGLMQVEEDYIPTDSHYIGIWVEGGIVGLCLYITLQVIVLLRACYIIMFKIKNKQLAHILAALLAAVFGIWLNGYVGRGMGFQPSSFVIAVFLSFVLNGPYMDKQLKKDEVIL